VAWDGSVDGLAMTHSIINKFVRSVG
jgi:hypothetical protein